MKKITKKPFDILNLFVVGVYSKTQMGICP